MRRDDVLVNDMLLAAEKIIRFTAGQTRETFLENDLIQSAVIREFLVLGEAARHISEEMTAQHPELAFHVMRGMRNRLVHDYFSADMETVWDTVVTDIPVLILQLRALASKS